jgi:hypothetical protein
MKQYLTIFSFVLLFNTLKAQEIFTPINGSNKWVDDMELFIQTIDSVKIKVNFLRSAPDYWIFETEFINQSTTADVLIDPFTFRLSVTESEKNRPCPVVLDNKLPAYLDGAFDLNLSKIIKKNTLEPKQSLYGLIFVKRCKFAKTLQLYIPIEGREFFVLFKK